MSLLTVTLGNQDVTAALRPKTLRVSLSVSSRGQAQFRLRGDLVTPQIGQPVTVSLDGTLIFSGTVEDITATWQAMGYLEWDVTSVDYTQVLDRRLVQGKWQNTLAQTVVQSILTDVLAAEGITAAPNLIYTGVMLSSYVANLVPASRVLDDLAKASGYVWFVDPQKQLHFHDRFAIPCPVTIGYNPPWEDLQLQFQRSTLRTRQWVRGGTAITATRTEQFVGDGQQVSFTLAYPAATVTAMTVNGQAVTFGERGKAQGVQWYWAQNDRQVVSASNTPLAANAVLAVTYQGYYPVLAVLDDASAIARQKNLEGGTGIYETIEKRDDLVDLQLALTYARGLLARYSSPRGEIRAKATNLTGVFPGQSVNVNLPYAKGYWLVSQVTYQDEDLANVRVEVQATSVDDIAGWSAFFFDLSRRTQTQAPISETLTRGQIPTDQYSIQDTVSLGVVGNITVLVVGQGAVGRSKVG